MLSVLLLIPGSATLLPEHITYICAIKVIDFAAPMLDFSCGRGTDKNAEFLKYIHFFKKILYPLVCGALQALPPRSWVGVGSRNLNRSVCRKTDNAPVIAILHGRY